MVGIQPGAEYTHAFVVPCDHAGGTHWYHAEQHGTTALQIGGGAVGMIVVDDAYEEGRTEHDMPDDVAKLPTAHFIVQEFNVGGSITNNNTAIINNNLNTYIQFHSIFRLCHVKIPSLLIRGFEQI